MLDIYLFVAFLLFVLYVFKKLIFDHIDFKLFPKKEGKSKKRKRPSYNNSKIYVNQLVSSNKPEPQQNDKIVEEKKNDALHDHNVGNSYEISAVRVQMDEKKNRQNSCIDNQDERSHEVQQQTIKKIDQNKICSNQNHGQAWPSINEDQYITKINQQTFNIGQGGQEVDKETMKKSLQHNSNRVDAVKSHYKQIINTLQLKLQELSIKYNQPIQEIDNNISIIFSEEESVSLGVHEEQLDLKLYEIKHLKEELQVQESLLGNALYDENQSKQIIQQHKTKNNKLQLSQSIIIYNKEAKRIDNTSTLRYGGEETNELTKSLISSSNLQKSTILIMSMIEGVGFNGLLNSCRFMNEINKKFILSEIKKQYKIKIDDTILLSPVQEEQKINISLYSIIKKHQNILILLKLSNQQKISIFIPEQSIENDPKKRYIYKQTTMLLTNLNPRKSFAMRGNCIYSNNQIILGKQQICMTDIFPFVVKSSCQWWKQGNFLVEQFEVYHIISEN